MTTRRSLLSLAERSIRQRGYDAVSFGDIADGIGIKTASVHYHFPKKADLAAALLRDYSAKLERQRSNIAMNAKTGGAAIASLVALYRAALAEGEQLCLCVALSAGRDSLNTECCDLIAAFHEASISWLEAQFSRAMVDGSAHGVVNPEAEANATLALLEGAQLVARAAENVLLYDAATRSLVTRLT